MVHFNALISTRLLTPPVTSVSPAIKKNNFIALQKHVLANAAERKGQQTSQETYKVQRDLRDFNVANAPPKTQETKSTPEAQEQVCA